MDTVRWVATLSNGETAVEHSGEYTLEPGQRMPWVRLCEFLAQNDLHLTSLRLNFKGRTIHMPRANFDRFDMSKSRPPLFYALEYKLEAEMGDDGTFGESKRFIDLIAFYDNFEVHYLQDLQEGNNSWVVVTQGYLPMAQTPRNNDDRNTTPAD